MIIELKNKAHTFWNDFKGYHYDPEVGETVIAFGG